jgi:threonine dehydratase
VNAGGYGAVLRVVGQRYAEALAACETHIATSRAMVFHAYDQVETLLGQGIIGLKLETAAPELDTLLIDDSGIKRTPMTPGVLRLT